MSKLKKGADLEKLPDPRKHQIVSFIKSGVRILGYGALWWDISLAASILILSEVIGIGEEMV
jgi:hypothetical protein